MDEAWKQARLDELWEAVFGSFRELMQSSSKSRRDVAVEILSKYQDQAGRKRETGDYDAGQSQDDHFQRAVTAYLVWQLMSLEMAEWSLGEISGFKSMSASGASPRSKLRVSLRSQVEVQWPSHSRAIDPMPLFLPRPLVLDLIQALEALDRGEVLPMVTPVATGRHDASWSWDAMRTRALQYVEFYRGQGHSKKHARSIVAIATGVSTNTLRDWDSSVKPTEPIQPAFEAGRIKILIEINPNYATAESGAVDADGYFYLRNQLAQPLSDFGREYQERHGRRHNQRQSDGD